MNKMRYKNETCWKKMRVTIESIEVSVNYKYVNDSLWVLMIES